MSRRLSDSQTESNDKGDIPLPQNLVTNTSTGIKSQVSINLVPAQLLRNKEALYSEEPRELDIAGGRGGRVSQASQFEVVKVVHMLEFGTMKPCDNRTKLQTGNFPT